MKLNLAGVNIPDPGHRKIRRQDLNEQQSEDHFPEINLNNIEISTKYFVPRSDWHRADIIAALHKAGTTVVGLSRNSGLSNSSLSNVFYRSWPRGEKIIADYLGVSPSLIWPSRYLRNVSCDDEPVSKDKSF